MGEFSDEVEGDWTAELGRGERVGEYPVFG
jgi:hypothetical protein